MKSLDLSWDFCHFLENTCTDQTVLCKHILKKVQMLSTLSPDMHVFKVALGWEKLKCNSCCLHCSFLISYSSPSRPPFLLYKDPVQRLHIIYSVYFLERMFSHLHGSHGKVSIIRLS